ncbi:MAG: AIPR family protein [Endomicrobiaceae bacterium]|nr:AIPR family protein [Endomicrobiaceae bacterium]
MNILENDILRSKIEALKEQLENDEVFKERGINNNDKMMSFSFVVYTLQRFLNNYNIQEIISDVTDGADDNKIDIFNIETDEEIVNINIFQVKYKKEQNLKETIGENDLNQFIDRIKKILIDYKIKNLHFNKYLTRKCEQCREIIKNSSINNIYINLYLVTNGADLNEQERKTLNDFKNENSIINHYEMLNDYNFFIDKRDSEIKEIEIKITNDMIKMNQDISSYIVNFRTYDLAVLYERFRESILEKNIRRLLTGKINKNIKDSLINEPELFWYKNNGLSIVCRRVEIKTALGEKTLVLENPYIVNGGQTTKTIYNLFQERQTEEERDIFYKSYIMARIYQTTEDEKIASIVYGTNNQNKITLFDLKSMNPNLKKIKEFFKTKNISLLIQRDCEEKRENKNINSDSLLQIYCSIFLEIPHKVKTSKNKVIEQYYDEVYNQNIHKELLSSFQIYEFVLEQNKDCEDANTKTHIDHSLYSLLFLMTQIDPSLKKLFNSAKAKTAYKKSLDVLNILTEKERAEDINYSPHNFFKSETSTIKIIKFLNKKNEK